MLSPIHHTFAPLGDRTQRALARRLLMRTATLQRGEATEKLRAALQKKFSRDAYLFASGREALLAFLVSQKWNEGDEVIVQGYTCMVVPNAIQAAGLVPVYADIEAATLNLDHADVAKRITPKTRAVICQHTFGIPAKMDELRALCDAKKILLIEDCAHVLPDEDGPHEIGRLGDVLLLSFGRDKAISGVTGGAILCQGSDALAKLEELAADLPESRIRRLLLYPLLYGIARPLYGFGIGKVLLWLSAKLGLLLPILSGTEKRGTMTTTLHHLPNSCAALALDQLTRLPELNAQRRTLTQLYLEESAARGLPVLHGIRGDLPLQKYPMFVRNAEHVRQSLKRKNIHLNDGWCGCVVCPTSAKEENSCYRRGEDPRAEEASEQILSLPTHPTMSVIQGKILMKAVDALMRNIGVLE